MDMTNAGATGGITGLVNRKLAIPNPAAVSLQDINANLKQTLDQLMLAKNTEVTAEVLKGMFTKPEPSPMAGLKDIGLNVGTMIETTAKMAQTATEQLYKERKEALDEKQKTIEREQKSETRELSTTKELLTTIINLQNQSHENQVRLLETLYKQQIEQQKDGKEDPFQTVLRDFTITLLRDRIEKPTPDPKVQILESIKTVRDLQGLLATNNNQGQNADALERLEKLKYDLELRKLDYEYSHKREERQDKNKMISDALGAFKELIAVLPTLRTANTSSTAAPVMHKAICPYCGYEIVAEDPSTVTACPHCKQSFVGTPNNKVSSSSGTAPGVTP